MILGDRNRPPQPDQEPKPEMASPFCTKCAGEIEMQLGYIPDHAHYNAILQPEWTAGRLVPGYFDIEKSGRSYAIRTYRCPQCGYLESYAPSKY